MKVKHLFFIGIVLVVLLVFFQDFLGRKSKDDYGADLKKARAKRDEFFKNDKKSPLKDKTGFVALNYYEPNEQFRIKANVEFLPKSAPFAIATTSGEAQNYEKFGYAVFMYQDIKRKLLLLKKTGDKSLFLPFADLTNNQTTYGGGRYLDVEMPRTDEVFIDFNLAFNPFCVYDDSFVCPIPPKENYLDFLVEAGEKKLKE